MIKITYENTESMYGDNFTARFDTVRGAQIFVHALEERGIEVIALDEIESESED